MLRWHPERSTTIFRKTTPAFDWTVFPEPAEPNGDLLDKAGSASSLAGFAVNAFTAAATDLRDAADELDLTAQLAQERIDQLTELLENSAAQAEANREAADKILALVGGVA